MVAEIEVTWVGKYGDGGGLGREEGSGGQMGLGTEG